MDKGMSVGTGCNILQSNLIATLFEDVKFNMKTVTFKA